MVTPLCDDHLWNYSPVYTKRSHTITESKILVGKDGKMRYLFVNKSACKQTMVFYFQNKKKNLTKKLLTLKNVLLKKKMISIKKKNSYIYIINLNIIIV